MTKCLNSLYACIATKIMLSGRKTTEATTTESMQEELGTSTDGSTDSTDEDYSYDDEDDTTTTTTTTGTDHSSKDDDAVVDSHKEQTLKSQYTGSVVVDNRPSDEPMTLDQLSEHVDSLSHHLDEPLPPPISNSDQLVDYFENPGLETEQSLLSAVENNTTTTTVENKVKSPIPDLENEQSTIDNSVTCVVDNTSPMTNVENENFTSETNNLISSIDDKVIEEIIASVVLLEHKGDEFPANELYTHEKTENNDLDNEEFVHVKDNEFATEIEESTKSELSGLVEEHYSKEVTICTFVYYMAFLIANK